MNLAAPGIWELDIPPANMNYLNFKTAIKEKLVGD